MIRTMEKTVLKKQRYFIERDLFFQTLTLLLTVLLGGFLLLLLSKTISGHIDSSLLFLMLFAGYFLLIIFFSWALSKKFIGPFSRLKENMKDISKGDLSLRLTLRSGDDIRIKSFIDDANRMIVSFNNCLDKVKEPGENLEEKISRLIYRIETDTPASKEEHLGYLQDLLSHTKEIRQATQYFKTRKTSERDA